jgi:integrase
VEDPKNRAAFLSSLETYCFPKFGGTRVVDVTSQDVRQAVLEVREKAPEVARKLTFRMAAVIRWAIAEGLRQDNPATAEALALPRVAHAVSHRKALPYDQVHTCLQAVRSSRAFASTKLAIEFLVLTAARSGEVRAACWDEIDPAAKVWAMPAERMKMKRPHRVPLSPPALAILEMAESLADDSGLVFPSPRGKALSDMTLSKLIKELGFNADIHGFRTSFRTWTQERTSFPREVCEAALAHLTGDAAERAYARSDLFGKRRRLMEAWAHYLAQTGKAFS